jgi:hypothetical protein
MLSLLVIGAACTDRQSASSQNTSTVTTEKTLVTSSSPNRHQPVRSIDFNHVAFPHYTKYTMRAKTYITLKAADGGPAQLNYGDVTGDGVEEAMMMLGIESRGSAILDIVYIFGMSNGKPILLWSFETGDRGDGGLRQVYADHGNLVVELFGKDRIIGRDLYRGDEPLAGPGSFTRARYEWREGEFRMKGNPEVLPNPSGDANAIMPPYFGRAGQ